MSSLNLYQILIPFWLIALCVMPVWFVANLASCIGYSRWWGIAGLMPFATVAFIWVLHDAQALVH